MTLMKWSNHPLMSELMRHRFDNGHGACRPAAMITSHSIVLFPVYMFPPVSCLRRWYNRTILRESIIPVN
jgi:hypothetical protein